MRISKEQQEALERKYSFGPIPEFEYVRFAKPSPQPQTEDQGSEPEPEPIRQRRVRQK